MKNKTPFIIIIAILLLIIAGLLIFIVTGNKKDSQHDNKQAMEPMQIETVSDAETDTEEASEEKQGKSRMIKSRMIKRNPQKKSQTAMLRYHREQTGLREISLFISMI